MLRRRHEMRGGLLLQVTVLPELVSHLTIEAQHGNGDRS